MGTMEFQKTEYQSALKGLEMLGVVDMQSEQEYAPNRLHLYLSYACPFACGILQVLKLKGLDHVISHSIVHPTWVKTNPKDPDDPHLGWQFRKPGDQPVSNALGHASIPCDDLLIRDFVTDAKTIRQIRAGW